MQKRKVGTIDISFSKLHPLLRDIALSVHCLLHALVGGTHRYIFMLLKIGYSQLSTFLHLLSDIFVLPAAGLALILSMSRTFCLDLLAE